MSQRHDINLIDEIKRSLNDIKKALQENKQLRYDNERKYNNIISEKRILEGLRGDISKGHPLLSSLFVEFEHLKWTSIANYLKTKKHPAIKASDEISVINAEKKEWVRRCKEAEFKVRYYESLFPEINDICEEKLRGNEYAGDARDEVYNFISEEEYSSMSVGDRNQLALDRYLTKKHSKQHIGKMYERYIGWMFESKGWIVEYTGIKNNLQDLGRDLICCKGCNAYVVQCKYWSSRKTIHENVINQLYGTTKKFEMELNEDEEEKFSITPILITNIEPSETAMDFAKYLGVRYNKIDFDKTYPIIKCNVSNGGIKIYHLPFDQQYDNTQIKNKEECYVKTVAEAERLGFRRAKKWIVKND